ncbi:MAG: hypothetical protein RSB24_08000 [Akkermansia sp.]
MKSIFFSSFLILTTAFSASAATTQLIDPITGITVDNFDSAGNLTGKDITGTKIYDWLKSKEAGWYTTAGNGDGTFGHATVNNGGITLTDSKGVAGTCAGLKLNVNNWTSYSTMTFSFNLTTSNIPANYTWSLWYQTTDNQVLQLGKDSNNAPTSWDVSYIVDETAYSEVAKNGNGTFYIVLGGTEGHNWNGAADIQNISLSGSGASIPEPSVVTLGLLGLLSLSLRRKRN